jgi:hypothetical protein
MYDGIMTALWWHYDSIMMYVVASRCLRPTHARHQVIINIIVTQCSIHNTKWNISYSYILLIYTTHICYSYKIYTTLHSCQIYPIYTKYTPFVWNINVHNIHTKNNIMLFTPKDILSIPTMPYPISPLTHTMPTSLNNWYYANFIQENIIILLLDSYCSHYMYLLEFETKNFELLF